MLQLVNEREVRGLVKLKFQDISGEKVVCHRMLQSTQKVSTDMVLVEVCVYAVL